MTGRRGTFAVRQDDPNGFGGDNGPRWKQLTVTIKDAKLTLNPAFPPNRANGNLTVRFDWKAE